MTAPVITAISFDEPFYETGSTITATVTYTTTNMYTTADLQVTITDELTNENVSNGIVTESGIHWNPLAQFTVSTTVSTGTPDPTSVTATDGFRTWTLQSNTYTGTAPPFDWTAVLTATA